MDGECCNKNCLKGRGGNDVHQKKRRKTKKDMDYNNSSRRLGPLGSRVMALFMKKQYTLL